MKTFPEINAMNLKDCLEGIKLGFMNRDSIKPEFHQDLDDRIAAMKERLHRLEWTEKRISAR